MISTSTYVRCVSLWLVVTPLLLISCTDDFSALNTPSDRIVADELDVNLLGKAFAQSQYMGMFGSAGPFQLGQSLFADLYSQYFATTAANFDSDQYVEVGRWIDGAWRDFYANAAPQIHLVEQFSADNNLTVENAVAKVWKVQMFHRITDYWGPIIYSQFGNGQTSVAYDSQEDVYMSFFATLDEAIAVLAQNSGGSAFVGNDQIYGGSVDQWHKFANSLKLRLAMRIRYVEPDLAKQYAEAAVAAGIIESNGDNAQIATTPNSRNPYSIITDWGEFRMSSAMESVLEGYEDPRIGAFYSPSVNGDSDGDGSPYEGMRNGLPRTEKGTLLNNQYSDMAAAWLPPHRGGSTSGPPMKVMSASEVYFLRAEGALLGWNMGGTAEELYNEGIEMSFAEHDLSGAEAYLASGSTPITPEDPWNSPALSDIPVAFDESASEERRLEQIITQKWLALYPDGWEAFAEYRRTGYPKLYPILNTMNPDLGVDDVFRRMTFVDSEYSENREATEAAVSLLSGPDNNATRIWWDAKQ